MIHCKICGCFPCVCKHLKQAPATHTDADLERAVRAALEAAAARNQLTVRSMKEALDLRDWDAAREIAMKGPPAIRALDPADIVASIKRGEGE